MRVRSVDDPRLAAGAQVVIAATDARAPAFETAWLRPDGLVLSLASRKDIGEVPPEAMSGARLVVDDRDAVRAAAAEFIARPDDDLVTLGEALAVGFTPPAPFGMRRVVFKSTGLAVQDVVTANAVYRLAGELGVGVGVEVEAVTP